MVFQKGHLLGKRIKKGEHLSPKTEFQKGGISLNKGKKCPETSKRMKKNNPMKNKKIAQKVSHSRIGKYCKENNPNWKGGIMSENHIVRSLKKYKDWRLKVFQRDKFTCQLCRKVGGGLEVHHIVSVKEILKRGNKKMLWDIDNGITLCINCHKEIDEFRR